MWNCRKKSGKCQMSDHSFKEPKQNKLSLQISAESKLTYELYLTIKVPGGDNTAGETSEVALK